MNPRRINIRVESFNLKTKRDFELSNVVAHIQGMYFVDALMATVGNMLGGKSAKQHEYPSEPYDFGKSKEMSEEEIQRQRELVVARFMAMQSNFNLHKQLKEQGLE